MDHIEYFKLQAKNLFKDYKTRFFNEKEKIYDYHPKYFDINGIFNDFDIRDFKDDFKFSLMNAQHLIAKLAGFNKWNDLLNAKPAELELAHLIFDNTNKLSIEEWKDYILQTEKVNHKRFSSEEKLDIFSQVFLSQDKHRSDFLPYRLNLEDKFNTLPSDLSKDDYYDSSSFYRELSGEEKISVVKEHQQEGCDFDDEEIVECIHCGEKYQFKNVKVIKDLTDNIPFVVCKNYPKCDGGIIDLMHVEKQGKK